MGFLLELNLQFLVGPGGIADVEPAFLVEVGFNGPIHERRSGDELDVEAGRKRKGVTVEFDLMGFARIVFGCRHPRHGHHDDRSCEARSVHETVPQMLSSAL